MCGILGIVNIAEDKIDLREAQYALNTMRHRGPDDEGYLCINTRINHAVPCSGVDTDRSLHLLPLESQTGNRFNAVFGHRRLSILDLTSAGHQPMVNADGRYWIVYNGEIYNYLELRAVLVEGGYVFRSASDTEVILAAFQAWGAAMLKRVIGMFAFAIYDSHAKKIFLARDNFGIKPLYYTFTGEQFAFASEIKALLELEGVTRKADPQSLYEFLRFGNTDHGERTVFADIRQIPPAHFMEMDIENRLLTAPSRYWQIDPERRQDISYREAVDRLRDLFEESICLHMRSDVPVGSCLSGGLDSSSIVAYMKKFQDPHQELHTFSYITDHPILSEEKYVDIVNRQNHSSEHKVRITPDDIVRDLDRLVYVQEQPFMSTSIYAQYRVFRLAQEAGIKVMLDGQGADEIFAGYYYLMGARITSLLHQGRLMAAWNIVRQSPQNMKNHRFRMILAAFGRMLPPDKAVPFMAIVGETLWPAWMKREWFMNKGVNARQRLYGRGVSALRDELHYSIEKLSLPQLLRFEDRNAMCHSIESRVPFCNPALAEFAFSLPDHYLLTDQGTTKAVFRQAMRGIVPDPILDREKVGFGTPEQDWLNALRPWIEKTLQAEETANLPFINLDSTRKMTLAELETQGFLSGYPWRCLNVFHWARVFSVEWN